MENAHALTQVFHQPIQLVLGIKMHGDAALAAPLFSDLHLRAEGTFEPILQGPNIWVYGRFFSTGA